MCKMTEGKNEDNGTLKKSGKEETMTLNKAAAPPTRSAMPAATGNISSSSSSSTQWLRGSRWLTSKDQKIRDGFSTKMKLLCTNFFVPNKEKLGHVSGTTAALWYPAVLSPGVVSSPGFPGRSSPPCFLFFSYSCGDAPNPKIL